MFEINYSQLIQYEILEKLVTFIVRVGTYFFLLFVFCRSAFPELEPQFQFLHRHLHLEFKKQARSRPKHSSKLYGVSLDRM